MNHHLFALAACAAFLLAGACSPATPRPDEDVEAVQTQNVVVTRDSTSAPRACRPAAVGETIVGFMQRVNAGTDPTGWFSSSFQWYSMSEGNPRADGRHFVAHDLSELSRYFDERATLNESMKLVELSVKYERGRDLGHIQYTIERHADDTKAYGTVAHGKGAIACDEGKIELMSIGMQQSGKAQLGLCPEPDQRDDDAAVVCVDA